MLDKITQRQIRTQMKYLRRLERLAAYVATRKPERFNFKTWVGSDWKGAQNLSCGTTACAFGYAPSLPYFRRLGVVLNRDAFGSNVLLQGSNGDLCGLGAAAKVFNLTEVETSHIFAPYTKDSTEEGYSKNCTIGARATPKQWAKHARRFIQDVKAGKRYIWNGDSPNRDYGVDYDAS
jgi:hypothetical protein